MKLFGTALLLFGLFLFAPAVSAQEYFLDRPLGVEKISDDELLVVDGGGVDWSNNGSEVFILNTQSEVVWHFKDELIFAHTAESADNAILITDTTNNRILLVDRTDKSVLLDSRLWSDGTGRLSDGSVLDYPNDAQATTRGFLITDRNNDRFVHVDRFGTILQSFDQFNRPHNADMLPNGNYLVSNSEEHEVLEVNQEAQVVWRYGTGEKSVLNWPRDADRLASGNTLITDSRNHRILEVTREEEVVWEYRGDLYWPFEADRLENGNTLISDSQNREVIEVSPEGEIIQRWQLGETTRAEQFTNGGFETVEVWKTDFARTPNMNLLDSSQTFRGWTPGVLLAEGSGLLRQDTTVVRSGDSSARIDKYDGGLLFWLQKIPVRENQTYTISGFIKADVEGDNQGARLEISWQTKRGGFIDLPVVSDWVTNDASWQKQTLTVTAPEGAIAANIRATLHVPGTAWFDDIRVKNNDSILKTGLFFVVGLVGAGIAIKFGKRFIQ